MKRPNNSNNKYKNAYTSILNNRNNVWSLFSHIQQITTTTMRKFNSVYNPVLNRITSDLILYTFAISAQVKPVQQYQKHGRLLFQMQLQDKVLAFLDRYESSQLLP